MSVVGPSDPVQTHPRKNSVSDSWVVASAVAALREGVCTAASRSGGGMGREHVGQVVSCAEDGDRAKRKICRVDTLRENSPSGSWVETSANEALKVLSK